MEYLKDTGMEEPEDIREKCKKLYEKDKHKRGDYAPFLAIIIFYLVIIFFVVTFNDKFVVPWIPLLTMVIVFLLCLFRFVQVAWFIVIFIISLFIIYVLLAIPASYIYVLVGVAVAILTAYGIIVRRYYWVAPLVAFVLVLSFIFFISKL
jgi:cation transport ATPase